MLDDVALGNTSKLGVTSEPVLALRTQRGSSDSK
jgi:hypothetical protein